MLPGPRGGLSNGAGAGGAGRSSYIHEAEERTKIKFLIQLESIQKFYFVMSLSSALYNLSGCGSSASG